MFLCSVMNTDERYDSEGRALPSKSILYEQTALTPERLVWDVNPELDAVVSSAVDLAVNVRLQHNIVTVSWPSDRKQY